MANDEHVALLKKDVKAWNEWRSQYRGDFIPDHADLFCANLRGRS